MSTSQILDFFRTNLQRLDPLCCNFSFVNGHSEEIIYNLSDLYFPAYHTLFDAVLQEYFPEIDRKRVDAISFQQADGKLYSEDKFMVSIDGAKQDCFFHPDIGCFNPWQHYCINVGAHSRERSYKFYDLDSRAYEVFQWPEFMIPFPKYGAGVGIQPDIVGVYFLSHDYDKVIEHLKMPDPLPKDCSDWLKMSSLIHNFGLTFNIKTGEYVKLSYFYYNDKARSDIRPYLKMD